MQVTKVYLMDPLKAMEHLFVQADYTSDASLARTKDIWCTALCRLLPVEMQVCELKNQLIWQDVQVHKDGLIYSPRLQAHTRENS